MVRKNIPLVLMFIFCFDKLSLALSLVGIFLGGGFYAIFLQQAVEIAY